MIFDSIQNKENYKEDSISGYRNSERSHSGEPSIIC